MSPRDLAERDNSPGDVEGRAQRGKMPNGLSPARCVTVELAALVTGYSKSAIRHKIERGTWIEGRQWVRRDGRVLIDLTGVERWHLTGKP